MKAVLAVTLTAAAQKLSLRNPEVAYQGFWIDLIE